MWIERGPGLDAAIDRVQVSAYRVPTDFPESDGTFEWDATTLVLVELSGGDKEGMGYSYTSATAAELIRRELAHLVVGARAMEIGRLWNAMRRTVRNIGAPGIASSAIAAVDIALWDLKARLLDLPLVTLLGQARDSVPAYGSGGFTSYPIDQLCAQLQGWVREGFSMVKMKIGRQPEADADRVRAVRAAMGGEPRIFVDANGAYGRKQALAQTAILAEWDVSWFEEPVSSEDLEGLRFLRDRAPPGMEIAAGEYGYDGAYFRRMLAAGAVDVLQADATRCAGITGFLQAGALCEAFQIPLSAHTAPSVHQHPCCALETARHVEYFHDHVRIEHMFFEGAAHARGGRLQPELSRPGLGLEFRHAEARPFMISDPAIRHNT